MRINKTLCTITVWKSHPREAYKKIWRHPARTASQLGARSFLRCNSGDFGQCHVYEEPGGDVQSYLVNCDLSFVGPFCSYFRTDECCIAMYSTDSDCDVRVQEVFWTSYSDGASTDVESVGSASIFECDTEDYDGKWPTAKLLYSRETTGQCV